MIMSKIKIGINGFGRIGRMVFRAAQERDDIEITGINDLQDVDYIAYMLKYDSTHGIFKGNVAVKDGALFINGRKIRVTSENDPANLKWSEVGAEYVCESTGFFLTAASVQGHLAAGADKVIITGPPKDETPMFVMGVNHTSYSANNRVISNASCTTNCLALVAKVLNDHWGIEEGLMTTIHAVTSTQKNRRWAFKERLALWPWSFSKYYSCCNRSCQSRGKSYS